MKYVMLGTLNRDWLARQKERTGGARKKLDELVQTVEENWNGTSVA